jgi:hypothetical protein
MKLVTRPLLGAIVGAVVLTACSGSSTSSQTPAARPTTSAAGPSSSTAGGAAASSPAMQKVNANTASQDQIEQALGAAGVPNATRWAREVVEYRPYPTDDPSFVKLRQELAKYNPSPDVVDKIVASLTL